MAQVSDLLACYSLILILVGTFGNFLTCLICFRLRKTTTFVFMAFAAIFDVASLYFWNLNHFTQTFIGIDLQSYSLISCRIGQFVQLSSVEISAWLLVLMTIDRLLAVSMNSWKMIYSTPKRAAYASALCSILLIGMNINVLFLFGYDETVSTSSNTTTTETYCFPSTNPKASFMTAWMAVYSTFYSYAPFAILLCANLALLVFLKQKRTANTEMSHHHTRRSAINRTIILVTLVFIILTGTAAVGALFLKQILLLPYGQTILFLLDDICFTYHAFSILILYLTNARFATELKSSIKANIVFLTSSGSSSGTKEPSLNKK